MLFLAFITATIAASNGQTCAGIDNARNLAAWATPSTSGLTTYADRGRLVYANPPRDRTARLALRDVEQALTTSTGRRFTIRCR